MRASRVCTYHSAAEVLDRGGQGSISDRRGFLCIHSRATAAHVVQPHSDQVRPGFFGLRAQSVPISVHSAMTWMSERVAIVAPHPIPVTSPHSPT